MLIFENIALAISGLWSNKMRALLTMLGIIIGISSVIGIVTVGNSMTAAFGEEMQSMGASNIEISVTQKPKEPEKGNEQEGETEFGMFGGVMGGMFAWSSPEESDLIHDDLIDRLKSDLNSGIKYVTTVENLSVSSAKSGKNKANIRAMGVNPDYMLANNISMITGRVLSSTDMQQKKKVCVVADKFAQTLFPGQDPIGKTVDLNVNGSVQPFYIVGVYKHKTSSGMFSMGGDISTVLYLPITTAKHMNNNAADGYNNITVVGNVGVDANLLLNDVNSFFSKAYQRNRTFTAQGYSMQAMVESSKKMLNTMSLAISVIAGISLLVGGIGVMNIMLVSITERTREIGTRKALGATNNSIRLQFIVESIIICLIGGIIGIILGLALGSVGAKLIGYTAKPSIMVISIAVAFSMAIGVFFGYYPANKAAKLDPIEALRYE